MLNFFFFNSTYFFEVEIFQSEAKKYEYNSLLAKNDSQQFFLLEVMEKKKGSRRSRDNYVKPRILCMSETYVYGKLLA